MNESEMHFAKVSTYHPISLSLSRYLLTKAQNTFKWNTALFLSVNSLHSLEFSSLSVLFSGSVHLHQDGGHEEIIFFPTGCETREDFTLTF